jgi:hypothetical protein
MSILTISANSWFSAMAISSIFNSSVIWKRIDLGWLVLSMSSSIKGLDFQGLTLVLFKKKRPQIGNILGMDCLRPLSRRKERLYFLNYMNHSILSTIVRRLILFIWSRYIANNQGTVPGSFGLVFLLAWVKAKMIKDCDGMEFAHLCQGRVFPLIHRDTERSGAGIYNLVIDQRAYRSIERDSCQSLRPSVSGFFVSPPVLYRILFYPYLFLLP